LLAIQLVKQAPADGHTLLLGSTSPMCVMPVITKGLPYDAFKDFRPVHGLSYGGATIIAKGDTPYKTLPDLMAAARREKKTLNVGNYSDGYMLVATWMGAVNGVPINHVPYKGGAAALQDLLGGRVAAWYATFATAAPHIEAGKVIPLASTGSQRLGGLPQVPTIAESGYPGFSATNWYAFVASSKVPAPVLERWNVELVKVLSAPDVVEQLNRHGLVPMPGSRDDLARYMAKETATWGRIIRERKISAQ
jgi:tripartite-type tricarboxylate transporter receptor subunit TctC